MAMAWAAEEQRAFITAVGVRVATPPPPPPSHPRFSRAVDCGDTIHITASQDMPSNDSSSLGLIICHLD